MHENLMRKLAEFEATEMPVLSIYLDMRPQATGENPGIRSGEIVLKDRLNEIEKTYRPRGADLDSFLTDREKIEEFLKHEFAGETHGLAIFACAAQNLWETVEVGAAFENEVAVGKMPDLFQLANLLDKHEKAVVAVFDTNTARFFVTDYGDLHEVAAPNDKNTKMFSKRSMGGWKQKKYQRNIENNREDFAKQAAQAVEELIEKENARKLIIAGDEVSVPHFQNSLTQKTQEILSGNVLRIDIRTPKDEIAAEVREILEEYENELSHDNADKAISEFKRHGFGVMGAKAVKAALENGQVETLLLDASSDSLTEEIRNEFIRLAATTGANVDMVENHEKFTSIGGIGALLRYKI